MPTSLAARVARTIQRRSLLRAGEPVAVAVSAGADSTALAWLLHDLARHASWRLVGLIHVNHGLRGRESDDDETFCRHLSGRLRLPIETLRADVRTRRGSIESAARAARYACFAAAARTLGATAVATAHTTDDQAETVMLRLLRGAGTRGLSAIRPRRDPAQGTGAPDAAASDVGPRATVAPSDAGTLGPSYVRPLIDCSRADVRAELFRRGETCREDSSNQDLSIPRNRLRATLLPALAQAWPGAVGALARLADLAAEEDAYLEWAAAEAGRGAIQVSGRGVQLDQGVLARLPIALARRMVCRALEFAGGEPAIDQVDAVLGLTRRSGGQKGHHLDVAGLAVDRSGTWLRLTKRRDASSQGPNRPMDRQGVGWQERLDVPGRIELPETALTISASLQEGADRPRFPAERDVAILQASRVVQPLLVRYRRSGDRLRPLGAPGSRKLQDVFVDRKIPRGERDRVPLVVDATGRIVWVAGLVIAHECRVTAPRAAMVILELKKGHQ